MFKIITKHLHQMNLPQSKDSEAAASTSDLGEEKLMKAFEIKCVTVVI